MNYSASLWGSSMDFRGERFASEFCLVNASASRKFAVAVLSGNSLQYFMMARKKNACLHQVQHWIRESCLRHSVLSNCLREVPSWSQFGAANKDFATSDPVQHEDQMWPFFCSAGGKATPDLRSTPTHCNCWGWQYPELTQSNRMNSRNVWRHKMNGVNSGYCFWLIMNQSVHFGTASILCKSCSMCGAVCRTGIFLYGSDNDVS